MKSGRILFTLSIVALTFAFAGSAFTQTAQKADSPVKVEKKAPVTVKADSASVAVRGTVEKIDGPKVTIKNKKGEQIVDVTDPSTLKGIAVGDKVKFSKGIITKITAPVKPAQEPVKSNAPKTGTTGGTK